MKGTIKKFNDWCEAWLENDDDWFSILMDTMCHLYLVAAFIFLLAIGLFFFLMGVIHLVELF